MDVFDHLDRRLTKHDAAEVRLIHTMLTRAGVWLGDGETFPFHDMRSQPGGDSWVEITMKFRMEDNRFPPAIEEIMGKFGYKLLEQGIRSVGYEHPPYTTIIPTVPAVFHFSVFWHFTGSNRISQ